MYGKPGVNRCSYWGVFTGASFGFDRDDLAAGILDTQGASPRPYRLLTPGLQTVTVPTQGSNIRSNSPPGWAHDYWTLQATVQSDTREGSPAAKWLQVH